MIELHSAPTPNGQKVMIMLEETGLPWKHVDVNIRLGEQFSPGHIKINPNNKIPSIIDTEGPGGSYSMMESGAILVYLAEKTGKFLPRDQRQRYEVFQWLAFQIAHVGPMIGQSSHFNSYKGDHDVAYSRDRYNNEVLRIFHVLDNRLRANQWLGGDEYSIADMATYPWTRGHKDRGITAEEFPGFHRWYAAMEARPAVQRNNQLTVEIRTRMERAAEGKSAIDIYNTRDNAERLAKATGR